jgi:hypothetical protein
VKVYLAGPMRGISECNFPAFEKATKELREFGYEVFSPHEHDMEMGFDPIGTDITDLDDAGYSIRDALGADLAWITANAEAIVVLPGWAGSKGARAEVSTAEAIGIPVYTMDYIINDYIVKTAKRHLNAMSTGKFRPEHFGQEKATKEGCY